MDSAKPAKRLRFLPPLSWRHALYQAHGYVLLTRDINAGIQPALWRG